MRFKPERCFYLCEVVKAPFANDTGLVIPEVSEGVGQGTVAWGRIVAAGPDCTKYAEGEVIFCMQGVQTKIIGDNFQEFLLIEEGQVIMCGPGDGLTAVTSPVKIIRKQKPDPTDLIQVDSGGTFPFSS